MGYILPCVKQSEIRPLGVTLNTALLCLEGVREGSKKEKPENMTL